MSRVFHAKQPTKSKYYGTENITGQYMNIPALSTVISAQMDKLSMHIPRGALNITTTHTRKEASEHRWEQR
jgi:hypothetical protein